MMGLLLCAIVILIMISIIVHKKNEIKKEVSKNIANEDGMILLNQNLIEDEHSTIKGGVL